MIVKATFKIVVEELRLYPWQYFYLPHHAGWPSGYSNCIFLSKQNNTCNAHRKMLHNCWYIPLWIPAYWDRFDPYWASENVSVSGFGHTPHWGPLFCIDPASLSELSWSLWNQGRHINMPPLVPHPRAPTNLLPVWHQWLGGTLSMAICLTCG